MEKTESHVHTEQLSDRDILRCAGAMLAEKGLLSEAEAMETLELLKQISNIEEELGPS